MDASTTDDPAAELAELDARVNALLPPRYQHCYGSVAPTSMGSAGVRYDPDGRVAWGEIWTTFCDLALAGGPPHRGRLLEAVPEARVRADSARSAEVLAEVRRAIGLTSGLPTFDGDAPGWVGVRVASVAQAAWLQFAVVAENVTARRRGDALLLPAGPAFRAEKEIKNVVVALAKAHHYWDSHLTDAQQGLAGETPWEPATPDEAASHPWAYDSAWQAVAQRVRPSGLAPLPRRYAGWLGIQLADEGAAVWHLRAVLADGVLARREERVLYLPIGSGPDPERDERVGRAFGRAHRLWLASAGPGAP